MYPNGVVSEVVTCMSGVAFNLRVAVCFAEPGYGGLCGLHTLGQGLG